jgi:PAS domain S-box-containing protein
MKQDELADTSAYWLKANPSFALNGKEGLMNGSGAKHIGALSRNVSDDYGLEDFFECAVVGIQWIDANGVVERANKAALDILGYEREEYISQNIFDFFLEKDTAREMLERLKSGETLKEFHAQMVHKDGSCRYVLVDANLVRRDGVLQHALCFLRDITAYKQASDKFKQQEEMLRQAQKMEAVGRLASGVAHDFNNLLTAIIGYSQLVLKKLNKDDPAHSAVIEIAKAGERSAALTSQLLTFSRKQIVEPKVLDLNVVISDTTKLLKRLIGEDIELVVETGRKMCKVKADAGQLCQVIMNLAVNSRDAMPNGGRLSISTSQADLSEKTAAAAIGVGPGMYVVLSVKDTGCGMSKEIQSQIFEPFFTTKCEGKGTGLGLSTVYGIVKQHDGGILVGSEEGKGSTFKIFLPSVQELEHESSQVENQDYPLRGNGVILLAEDEPLVRRFAIRVLEDKGYTILEAADGNDALAKAVEYGPKNIDMLLTDVVMPKMSGIELAKKLLSLNPSLKILYTSGYMDQAFVPDFQLNPDENFLRKPFFPLALVQRVHEILSSSKF